MEKDPDEKQLKTYGAKTLELLAAALVGGIIGVLIMSILTILAFK